MIMIKFIIIKKEKSKVFNIFDFFIYGLNTYY